MSSLIYTFSDMLNRILCSQKDILWPYEIFLISRHVFSVLYSVCLSYILLCLQCVFWKHTDELNGNFQFLNLTSRLTYNIAVTMFKKNIHLIKRLFIYALIFTNMPDPILYFVSKTEKSDSFDWNTESLMRGRQM